MFDEVSGMDSMNRTTTTVRGSEVGFMYFCNKSLSGPPSLSIHVDAFCFFCCCLLLPPTPFLSVYSLFLFKSFAFSSFWKSERGEK